MEGAEYGGGLSEVQWRVRSTVEGYLKYSGGCKYGGGLSCSTVEDYHIACGGAIMQYSGGCKYGGGLSCSTVEDYHIACGGAIMQYSGGCKYGGVLSCRRCIVLRSDLVISLTKVCCLENLISFLKNSFEAPVSRNTLSGVIQWEFIKILRF